MPPSPARRPRRASLIWVIGLIAGIAVGGVVAYGLTSATRDPAPVEAS